VATAAGLPPDATADQLRALPMSALVDAGKALRGVEPIVDGRLIMESSAQGFASGDQAGVPLIIGSNSDEASLMRIFKIPAAVIAAQVPADMKSLYPGDVDAVAAAVFNDNVMGAPARWIAAQSSAQAPAYLYHFSYVPTARRSSVPGAGHGSEIPFVFGNWPAIYNNFASADDHAMETLMHSCWVAFAKTGTPKCGGMDWPAYSPDKDELMEFGLKSGPEAGFRKPQYDALQHVTLPRLVSGG
jgi:para-nitrobenzyl esterase